MLDAVGSEINPRAVLGLIGEAGGVQEEAGLGSVVPLGARAGDALLVALIEHDVAFGDDFVSRFIDSHFVGLQAIGADARVDVSFVNKDARFFRSGNCLRAGIDLEQVSRLARLSLPGWRSGRLTGWS